MNLLLEVLANELIEAERSKQPVVPLTQRYPELTVTDAYRIQLDVMGKKRSEGRRVIGRKVGLTSLAMQKMLGVDEPDYGHLLDDMRVADGEK